MPRSEDIDLQRQEWKQLEAVFKEIPFSHIRIYDRNKQDYVDGSAYVDSIVDPHSDFTVERSKPSIFSVISSLEGEQGNTDKVKDILRRIASMPGCLTPTRWKVLELWLNGKTKRDITCILYPDRIHDIEKGKGAIGVEVYVQRLLNHYIPMKMRFFVEMHWPHVVWKYLNYYPLHPKFVKRAWVEAVRQPGDTMQNFLLFYNGNPAALFMLRKIFRDYANKKVLKYEQQYYPNLVSAVAASAHVVRSLSRKCLTRDNFESSLFNDGEENRSILMLLYVYFMRRMPLPGQIL